MHSEADAIGVFRKRYSENMQQIYRRTPIPKFGFNKVPKQLYWNYYLAWMLSCKFAAQILEYFFLRTLLKGWGDIQRGETV